MSTINTNVNSMIAQRVLGQQNQQLNNTLQKLSTGLRINSGKDDPSGLIASENLRSQETAINAAIGNAERADSVINVAEGGLKEVSSQLRELQGLVSSSANESGLSEQEKEANQQEVDAILSSIDRIADTTNFQGQKLLNGSMDFQISNQSGAVDTLSINQANAGDDKLSVDASVTASAQKGGLYLSTGGSLDLSAAGASAAPEQSFDIEVAGNKGSKEFSFTSGTTTSAMADAINSFKDTLGVSATASGSGVRVNSTEFGSDQFVSVKVVDDGDIQGGDGIHTYSATDTNSIGSQVDTFANLEGGTATQDNGQDVQALVNGQKVDSSGRTLDINLDNLNAEVTLSDSSGSALDAQTTGSGKLFDAEGGAKFNIGADVSTNNRIQMSMGDVQSRDLGKTNVDGAIKSLSDLGSSGSLNVVDGDLSAAQDVVDKAVKEVSSLRGRLGSVQKNTLQPTMNSLNVAKENTASAESNIRDTDFANATAELSRSQVLSQSARNSLSIANSNPRSALSLLGG
jgi:flagellin